MYLFGATLISKGKLSINETCPCMYGLSVVIKLSDYSSLHRQIKQKNGLSVTRTVKRVYIRKKTSK